MELDGLKGKTLDDESFAKLRDYVADLVGQRDQARRESIDGRKSLKARAEAAEARASALEDWAGIDAGADLAELPAPKGNADAVKQFEAKLKRAERERDEATRTRDEALQLRAAERRQAAIAQAAAKHNFIDVEDAQALIGSRLQVEGDEILFKADGGKLVPLDEGAAWLAKAKPHLVRPQGGTGSGYRDGAAGGAGMAARTMTRAEFESADHAARSKFAREGGKVID